ncbi:hypothetical protein [Psychromonas sp. MB-3u-54]|nr:hypothetical protein [Psychromonas sp. MB-3u-54]
MFSNDFKDQLPATGIDLIVVSGDSEAQRESHLKELSVNFPLA